MAISPKEPREPRRQSYGFLDICLADERNTVDLLGDTILHEVESST